MSVLNKTNQPLVDTKLTDKGRLSLALGQLDFAYYALGDTEYIYGSNSSTILSAANNNPVIKNVLGTDGSCELLPLNAPEIQECAIFNKDKDRGITDVSGNFIEEFVQYSGTTSGGTFDGSFQIDLGTSLNFDDGDVIYFKFSDHRILPYQMYNVMGSQAILLDKALPIEITKDIEYYVLKSDLTSFNATSNYVFDGSSLKFKECEINDCCLLSFNIVRSEELIGHCPEDSTVSVSGLCGTDEVIVTGSCSYIDFESQSYIGIKKYFDYFGDCLDNVDQTQLDCNEKILSFQDTFNKSIGIIHQSCNGKAYPFKVSSNKQILVDIPNVMWHGRFAPCSGQGTELGMHFVSDSQLKYSIKNGIPYYDLIEDISLNGNRTPIIVGKVFADFGIIIIEDEELLAALSYNSNRNHTLIPIDGTLVTSKNGASNGILSKGQSLYVTYALTNNYPFQEMIPCQQYTILTNTSDVTKDVNLTFDANYFPYLKKIEDVAYDDLGYFAKKFKVLFQIVEEGERPIACNWKVTDFTSTDITLNDNETIAPKLLEGNAYLLDNNKVVNATSYKSPLEYLCGGKETFFNGRVSSYSTRNLYRSIFNIKINSSVINSSKNCTYTSDYNIVVTEVGIYNSKKELVLIAKISEPIELISPNIYNIKIKYDF